MGQIPKVAQDEVVGAISTQPVTFAQEVSHHVARSPHIGAVRDSQCQAANRSWMAGPKT
jgi:hypothetical protein